MPCTQTSIHSEWTASTHHDVMLCSVAGLSVLEVMPGRLAQCLRLSWTLQYATGTTTHSAPMEGQGGEHTLVLPDDSAAVWVEEGECILHK